MMKVFKLGAVLLFVTLFLSCQKELPTAVEIAREMKLGWNVGNSLEVPGGETKWGNPVVTKQLIDSVSAAGFNVLRIPCAWNSYADSNTLVIDENWLARVKEVVDYAYANGMYVIVNSHWDDGWLEEHPVYAYQEKVNHKQKVYWTQIANYFSDYDEHLLFAGTNEVRENYGEPTPENIEVQESYNQTFVDAVRATGSNNATRTLIVQTYNTNTWHGLKYMTLPDDSTDGRLMVEIHHYDPYDFTLNVNGGCMCWGEDTPEEESCAWAQEAYVDTLFSRIKQKWTDIGIPVVMGEYGAMRRTAYKGDTLMGKQLAAHTKSRAHWLAYNTQKARACGVIPVYWDNGYIRQGDSFGLFNRETGEVFDRIAIQALTISAGI